MDHREAPKVPNLETALEQLKDGFPLNHFETTIGPVTFGLRLSRVPRRGEDQPLDIDPYRIKVEEKQQKSGYATKLVQELVPLAWKKYGRGVFIENCITPASEAWAASLVRKEIAEPSPFYDNIPVQRFPNCYFCPLPK